MRCCKVDNKKDVKLSIRVSYEDYKFLMEYSELCNTSVSDALRKIIKLFRITEKKI